MTIFNSHIIGSRGCRNHHLYTDFSRRTGIEKFRNRECDAGAPLLGFQITDKAPAELDSIILWSKITALHNDLCSY